MFNRKSHIFFLFIAINVLFWCLMFVHANLRQGSDTSKLTGMQQLVSRLELTDLCLFTDARYTRHPSMADMNTAFQDYPLALEHFPSGSLLPVPPHLRSRTPE